MATALDTSILVKGQRAGNLQAFLTPDGEPYYVPALAAAEFLLGIHLVQSPVTKQKGQTFYFNEIKPRVVSLDEPDAVQLALLNAEQRISAPKVGFYDSGIAATAMARGDEVFAADSDFDRIKGLTVRKPSP